MIAAGQFAIPLLPSFRRQHLRVAAEELGHQAVHFRMIRDDQEVQGPGKLGAQAAGAGDFLAPCEAEGVFLPDPVHGAGVDGDGGVQVGVTPEHAGRKVPPGIG